MEAEWARIVEESFSILAAFKAGRSACHFWGCTCIAWSLFEMFFGGVRLPSLPLSKKGNFQKHTSPLFKSDFKDWGNQQIVIGNIIFFSCIFCAFMAKISRITSNYVKLAKTMKKRWHWKIWKDWIVATIESIANRSLGFVWSKISTFLMGLVSRKVVPRLRLV